MYAKRIERQKIKIVDIIDFIFTNKPRRNKIKIEIKIIQKEITKIEIERM